MSQGVSSMAEGALKFVLAHEAVASVVAGMMRPHEVDLNVAASGEPLSDAAVEQVRELYQDGFQPGVGRGPSVRLSPCMGERRMAPA